MAAVQSCPGGQMILPFRLFPQKHLEDVGNVVDCTNKSVSSLFISTYIDSESVDEAQIFHTN